MAQFLAAADNEKEYKVRLDGKDEDRTPDWTAYRTDGEIGYILDLANFHGDGKFEESMLGGPPATVPSDELVLAKLYESMKDKCLRYRELADHFGCPWSLRLTFISGLRGTLILIRSTTYSGLRMQSNPGFCLRPYRQSAPCTPSRCRRRPETEPLSRPV